MRHDGWKEQRAHSDSRGVWRIDGKLKLAPDSDARADQTASLGPDLEFSRALWHLCGL